MTHGTAGHDGPNRDLRLLICGQAVSSLGSHACMLAFPLVALALTGSPALAGVVGFAAAIPALVLQVPAGVLVDRRHRRRVMVGCDAGRLALMLVLAAAVATDVLTVAGLITVAVLYASLSVVFGLAQTAAIPSVVTPEALPKAIARNQATMQGTVIAGQPLGGWLFGVAAVLPFAVNAASFAVSLVTLLGLRSDLSPGREAGRGAGAGRAAGAGREAASWRREAGEGLRFVWRTPVLRALSLLSAGSTLLTGGFMLVMVVHLGALGAPPAQIGLLFGLCGAAGVLGAVAAPSLLRRLGSGRAYVVSIVGSALAALVLAGASTVGQAAAAAAVIVALGPPSQIVVQVARARTIPRPMFGRVHAVENTIAASTAPLAALLTGIALERFGSVATCLAVGVGLLAVAGAALAVPALRTMADPPAPAPVIGRHRRPDPVRGRHRRHPVRSTAVPPARVPVGV